MSNQPRWFDDKEVGNLVLVEGGEHMQVLGGEVTLMIMIMMTMMMILLNMMVTIMTKMKREQRIGKSDPFDSGNT